MKIGIEREFLLYDNDYQPINYKNNELPSKSYVVDYSDNQIEIVSQVHSSIESLISEMYKLMDEDFIVNNKMWPLSQPGEILFEPRIKGADEKGIKYREYLKEKYPKELLLMSGIHLNYSVDKTFTTQLEKEKYYFNLMKKIYLYGPIMLQFFAYSPVYNNNYKDLKSIGNNYGLEGAISLRNSNNYGYSNENIYVCDYSSYENYLDSIEKLVTQKEMYSKAELYNKVRHKKEYIELRFIDINPYSRLGIEEEKLNLMIDFLQYLETIEITEFNQEVNLENFELVATKGQNQNLQLNINGVIDSLENHTKKLLKEIDTINSKSIASKYVSKQNSLDKLLIEIKKTSVDQFGKRNIYQRKQFSEIFKEYDLELSTKILMKEAMENNYFVEVLDENSNVIKINNHLIVQATKTNCDRYANILMMENKLMTKKILNENNIKVPKGISINNINQIDYKIFKDKKMVIKPLDTNFGLGITMINPKDNKLQIDDAIKFAFSHSNTVIIEEYISGIEYRFLIINDKCESIIQRVAAHVVGDGINTIEQLVKIKNENPLRSIGYKTPVELVRIKEYEEKYLEKQGLEKIHVPKNGETVYLRENSNVSTGGDTVEVFEQIPNKYKKISEEAAKALDVKICGIDLIINQQKNEYAIIEANFNPAIQMHTYPLTGYGKNVAKKILELLDEQD